MMSLRKTSDIRSFVSGRSTFQTIKMSYISIDRKGSALLVSIPDHHDEHFVTSLAILDEVMEDGMRYQLHFQVLIAMISWGTVFNFTIDRSSSFSIIADNEVEGNY